MSDKIYFQIYYGDGEIRYNSEGVDLSDFPSVTKGISKANERSLGAVINWFHKLFNIDPDKFGLRISAVS